MLLLMLVLTLWFEVLALRYLSALGTPYCSG
ncbi:hypothetical protein GME_03547 [Halomonas sp. TD01]|nr:hypothetical protein GME_03547 [Halomonas sp. TD01]